MSARFTIVGLGEALFDVFPDRQVLGGAPLNAAIHAHQLAMAVGGRGVVVSRVGQDDLGAAVVRELTARGMDASFVQSDPDHDTGKVYVGRDERGEPTYEIVANVAWDWLSFDPEDEALAQHCEAVCFGTLAQREGQTRNAIYRFLDAARRAIRLFDVNLRQKFYDARIVARSCELATVVKLNHEELPVVCKLLALRVGEPSGANWIDRHAAAILARHRHLTHVAVTRGPEGTVVYTPNGRTEGKPASFDQQPGRDSVGAGDACAAGLLVGLLQRWPLQRTVDLANLAGAYVASVPGATPLLPATLLEAVR